MKRLWLLFFLLVAVAPYSTSQELDSSANKHPWLSDVFVGAGTDILFTELIYATHQYKWSKRKIKLTGLPAFYKGFCGMYVRLAI